MPWDRRQRTGSTGSDDHNVGREPATLDGDAPVAKLGAAFEISDGIIGRQQVHILCLPQLGDQRILAALDRPPILHSGLGVDPAKAYGTCVNTGCVPSKNLIRATEGLHHAAAEVRFGGINAEARVEDWRAVKRGKDALVSKLRQAKYVDCCRPIIPSLISKAAPSFATGASPSRVADSRPTR